MDPSVISDRSVDRYSHILEGVQSYVEGLEVRGVRRPAFAGGRVRGGSPEGAERRGCRGAGVDQESGGPGGGGGGGWGGGLPGKGSNGGGPGRRGAGAKRR